MERYPRETNAFPAATTPLHYSRHARVSPYPERNRTPMRSHSFTAQRSLAREINAFADGNHDSFTRSQPPTATATACPSSSHASMFQLKVRPIVKSTIAQREASGEVLDDFNVDGNTFSDIMQTLWREFRPHIQSIAANKDGVWSKQAPNLSEWASVMQFKFKKHLVDSSKTEQAWNEWLASRRGDTVQLLIYKFGLAVKRQEELDAFMDASASSATTNQPTRVTAPPPVAHIAEATASTSVPTPARRDVPLSEIIKRLKERWSVELEADDEGWRLWAVHVKQNSSQSTLNEVIDQLPPESVIPLLRTPMSRAEMDLQHMQRSSHLALDCVDASIEDVRALRREFEAFGRLLDSQYQGLVTRKRMIEAYQFDLGPTSRPKPIPSQRPS